MKFQTKQYEVEAWPIEVVEAMGNGAEPGQSALLDLLGSEPVYVDGTMTARYWPKPGDYLVEAPQPDGSIYTYINPKEVFESKYEPSAMVSADAPPGDPSDEPYGDAPPPLRVVTGNDQSLQGGDAA